MNMVIDEREIGSIPLVERKIYIKDKKIFVEFSLIDDLNLEIQFYKAFKNNDKALAEAQSFARKSKEHSSEQWKELRNFHEQQAQSRILLVEYVLSGFLEFPCSGKGLYIMGV